MRQKAITGVLLALVGFVVAGCVDVTVNKAWRRCKEDPCSDRCEADLRDQYCDFYEDSKCDQCWSHGDGGMPADSGLDANEGDAAIDGGERDVEGGGDGRVEDASADGADGTVSEDGRVPDCTRNLDCSAALPVCASGECGRCRSNADCSGRTDAPVCDTVSGACVICTVAKPDACTSKGKVCKESGAACVGCNKSEECGESAPHCGTNNECGVCVADSDCAKFGKVCDTSAGQCVQCTGAKTEWCNGSVCDSKARLCAVSVFPKSAGLCEACLSDAQCGKDDRPARCLPTSFAGQDLGYFCQPALESGESCIGNHRPYVADALDTQGQRLRSIDGATDASCKLATTTCAAMADFRSKSCAGPADAAACGVVGLDDGLCRPIQTVHRCSVPCRTTDDCSLGSTCPTGGGACSL